jgi:hypothetical protein
VISAEFAGDGYQVVTTTGRLAARCVVIASGGQRRPVIPRMASRLAADPAEYPQPEAGRSPETMSLRAERIAVVVWYTGFGPHTAGASPRFPACTRPASRGCPTAGRASSTASPPTRRGSPSTSPRVRAGTEPSRLSFQ